MEKLITINGNLIPLDKIYQITPIVGNNCWSKRGYSELTHSAYSFEILFLNEKSFHIRCTDQDMNYEDYWYADPNVYETRLLAMYTRLEILRDKLEIIFTNFLESDKTIKLEL